MNTERENCLRRLSEAAFALHEAVLYLDTHPDDRMALDYYNRYQKLKKKLAEEYNDRFGPLTADDAKTADGWTWGTTPWPWETEE